MWKFLLNFIPGVGPFLSEGATLMGGIFSFIAKHWKVFAVLAMIGTIAYQNFESKRFVFFLETIPHEQLVIKQDEAQIVSLKSDLQQAVTANQKLSTAIGALNTTVGEWESKTTELQKENDALQGKLNQMRTDTNNKVTTILNTTTPATCEASIQFLRNESKGLTW